MRKNGPNGWEDGDKARDLTEDIESGSETRASYVSGEAADEDYMWRRPEEGQEAPTKTENSPRRSDNRLSDLYGVDEDGLTSSERLYRKAWASRDRGEETEHKEAKPKEEPEFFYKKKADPKPIILRSAITLGLLAVVFGLFLAIQKELKIREGLKNTKPTQGSGLAIAGSESEASTTESAESLTGKENVSSKALEESVEVQIVGNWFDRYEEIQDFFSDEKPSTETEQTTSSQN